MRSLLIACQAVQDNCDAATCDRSRRAGVPGPYRRTQTLPINNHFVFPIKSRNCQIQVVSMVRPRIAVLNLECDLTQVIVDAHSFALCKAIAAQDQMNAVASVQNVQAPSYSIFRDHLGSTWKSAKLSSISSSAEDGIVGDNYGSVAQRAGKSEINFAAVLPGTARLLFSEPV